MGSKFVTNIKNIVMTRKIRLIVISDHINLTIDTKIW